jgi:hypothetical protein
MTERGTQLSFRQEEKVQKLCREDMIKVSEIYHTESISSDLERTLLLPCKGEVVPMLN